MSLSVASWNILYDVTRPRDDSRFGSGGKANMLETKALTGALAFFCYKDNTSPSHQADPIGPCFRQKVTQTVAKKECVYYRGGSNAEVRMPLVIERIQSLANQAHVICLQEVTQDIADKIRVAVAGTHKSFFSFLAGNNHGTMVLVNKQLTIEGKPSELTISDGSGQARKVRVVDVRDPMTNAVVRVASAHLYGHHNPPADVNTETSKLFKALKQLPGHYDGIVIAADVNEKKYARDKVKPTDFHHAKIAGGAGWNLDLTADGSGEVPVQPKPAAYGLCSIMMDEAHHSIPLAVPVVNGLSDHDPIGTQITITPKPKPKPQPKSVPTPPRWTIWTMCTEWTRWTIAKIIQLFWFCIGAR